MERFRVHGKTERVRERAVALEARALFVSCALSAWACGPGEETDEGWPGRYGYAPEEVHEIRTGLHGFPLVPVVIDADTLDLVFDTGNMVGVTLTAAELEDLRLPRIGSFSRLASDGSVIGRYGVYRAERVSVLGIVLEANRVYEFEDPDLPGLVGPRFLRGRRFTLDLGRRRMAVSDRPRPPSLESLESVPLVRSDRHPDLLLVYGLVEGRRVLMELDTGKSRTTIDPALADTLGLPRNENGVRIDRLRVGTRSFEVPSAKLVTLAGIDPDLEPPIRVGIGADLLGRVVFTVDQASGRVWFHR